MSTPPALLSLSLALLVVLPQPGGQLAQPRSGAQASAASREPSPVSFVVCTGTGAEAADAAHVRPGSSLERATPGTSGAEQPTGDLAEKQPRSAARWATGIILSAPAVVLLLVTKRSRLLGFRRAACVAAAAAAASIITTAAILPFWMAWAIDAGLSSGGVRGYYLVPAGAFISVSIAGVLAVKVVSWIQDVSELVSPWATGIAGAVAYLCAFVLTDRYFPLQGKDLLALLARELVAPPALGAAWLGTTLGLQVPRGLLTLVIGRRRT